MALLDISEPGEASAPPQKRIAAGIDLGTTHSLIASLRNSTAEVLKDAFGDEIIPSVVHYGEAGVLVGAKAVEKRREAPSHTLSSIKRLMGRSCEDLADDKFARIWEIEASETGLPLIQTPISAKSAVEVSADILRYLRCAAEAALGNELSGVVITVPAYFNDAQRQATKDAARLAGLVVFRLLNEPTAAAIAYGLDKKAAGTVAIYDLGGGTFDISILHLEGGVFRVLATGGDTSLGGDDFDRTFALRILDKCQARKIDELSPAEKSDLLSAARVAKEQLTSQATLEFTARIGEQELRCPLSYEDFAAGIQAAVERTMRISAGALRDAQVKIEDVDAVILVGGSTRVPLVQERVRKLFGREPLCSLDPDKVVSLGAAIQANILAGNQQEDLLLLDVIPLSLGLETMGGLNEKLIQRNSSIPIIKHHDFTTYKDGQVAMSFHIVQGERELVKDCRSLAHFVLHGIPPQPAGLAKVRVTFQVDADGLLSVSAQELSTGVQAGVEVKPTYGLSEKEILEILEKSYSNLAADTKARQLKELQNEAEQLLRVLKDVLADESTPVEAGEKAIIEEEIKKLSSLLERAGNAEELQRQIARLSRNAEAMMQRRLSETLKRKLKTKK